MSEPRPTDERAQIELPKAYTPRDVEGAIYERWLAAEARTIGFGVISPGA